MNNSYRLLLKNSALVLICIWLGTVIYWNLRALSGLLTVREYVFQSWSSINYWTLYFWVPWVPLVPVMLYLVNAVPVTPHNWVRSILAQLGLMFLLIFAHGFVCAMLYHHVNSMDAEVATYAPWQHTGHFLFGDDVFLFDVFIYAVVVASQNIRHFYALARQKEVDAVRMENQLSLSRLQTLKMQINPHFLFNTLNSISVLVRKQDTEKAGLMIDRLSSFFRQTLEESATQLVTVEREMEMVRQYLDIEKVRIGDRLKVIYQIPESVRHYVVPMLITQPIVENSIKHGVGRKPGPCELKITLEARHNRLKIKVSDTGSGHEFSGSATERVGIGLSNVRDRLRQIYAGDASIKLDGIKGVGVQVTIDIPLQESELAEVVVS